MSKVILKCIVIFCFLLGITSCKVNKEAFTPDDYTKQILNGLSNSEKLSSKPCYTPGNRTYIIGTQDGNFPDMGGHVAGEMGGIWLHPIKLLDGFWLKLNDDNNNSVWLDKAESYTTYPYASKFTYSPVLDGIKVERLQFCPEGKEGIVVLYTIKNNSSQKKNIELTFTAKTDISPVWYSKENGIIDADDQIKWNNTKSLFTANDTKHTWFAVWSSTTNVLQSEENAQTPIATKGLGKSGSISSKIVLKKNESKTIAYIVCGSNKNIDNAFISYNDIKKNYNNYLIEKQKLYDSVINRTRISIPDKKLEQVYNWTKINTQWLVMNLPGYGNFLGAGLIEYPWLFGGDNSYAQQGVVATGDFDLAKSTLTILKNVSEKVNKNGRIIHEMSSNGFVFNKGNTQETGHFIVAAWNIFQWTGDINYLKNLYPYIKKGINWLLIDKDSNHNMFPEGYGLVEISGLDAELIDCAVYTQQALYVTSQMAQLFNEPDLQKDYANKANKLKDKINTLFWDNDYGTYTDFYGTRDQAISGTEGSIRQITNMPFYGDQAISGREGDNEKRKNIIAYYKNLIEQIKQYPEGTSKGWLINKNFVNIIPVEVGIAPQDKAIAALNKVRNEHCGEYGPYLSAVEKASIMTISTGVQAVAECTYNRTDEALWYLNKIVNTFGLIIPGSITEVMPDYGTPAQAWTIYAIAVPLITHIYGVKPDAYNKKVTFAPHLPTSWDKISISNLKVGSNNIEFKINTKNNKGTSYTIVSKEDGWNLSLNLKGITGKKYEINGKILTASSDELSFKGKNNQIIIYR